MERFVDARFRCRWRAVVAVLLLRFSCGGPTALAQTSDSADSLNIDCGATETYVDGLTNLTWVPDADYISTGKAHTIEVVAEGVLSFTEMKTLRYFDDPRPKNCFTLPVTSGSTYLLRVTFYYGNYDNMNQPPSFQVALDATILENVTAPSGNDATYGEYHYMSQGNESLLCLVRTSPEQTPFISGISLKPASGMSKGYTDSYGMLLQKKHVMKTRTRVNYGGTELIRYAQFGPPPCLLFNSCESRNRGKGYEFVRISQNACATILAMPNK